MENKPPQTLEEAAKIFVSNCLTWSGVYYSTGIFGSEELTGIFLAGAERANQNDTLAQQLQLAIDALEFMTMPVTSMHLTVENLLETIENDIARGKEALFQIKALEPK